MLFQVLFLAIYIVKGDLTVPLQDGHFFYADMAKGDVLFPEDDSERLQEHMGALVGVNNQSLSFVLSTMDSDTWIYSS